MSSSHNSHKSHLSPPPTPSSSPDVSADEAEWKAVEIEAPEKTWKDNIFVPLGLLGGAVALGGALVIKGRGDGRGLSQRIMEARVAAQAALLLGLVTAGYALSKSSKTRKEED